MDLHEELERRARVASAGAADRLGAAAAGDALVALVGRRRRRRAASFAGASVACVAAVVAAVAYVGPWSPGEVSPAVGTSSGTTVIDASTPLADAPVAFPRYGEKAPMLCGEEYSVPSGATRQVDDASRWPLTVTASAAVMGSDAGALGPGEDLLTWTAEVAPRGAVEDLAFTAYAVVEHDGRVAASSYLGSIEPAGGGALDQLDAPVPGLCGGLTANTYPDDGDYTFHLWVQVVDGKGTPVATVVDPVAPVTLAVTGIADYWNGVSDFDGLPNLSLDRIECGDPSPVEGRLWESAGYSESLPDGVVMPGWSASIDDGDVPIARASLDAPLLPDAVGFSQGFGVVDGVVVAFGEVQAGSGALDYTASLGLYSPCGVSAPSSMDVYVLHEAVVGDGANAQVEAAVVFRLGPIAVAPAPDVASWPPAGASVPAAPFTLSADEFRCGDEWTMVRGIMSPQGPTYSPLPALSLAPVAQGIGWNVELTDAGSIDNGVSWLTATYAVADGRVVGATSPLVWDTPSFAAGTLVGAAAASCDLSVTGEVEDHVIVQAVVLPDPNGPWVPVAIWVDPFAR